MADILIKDMEMPKSCAFCRFYGVYCYAKGDENAHSTLPCPLIPVPPHGDLIDINTLKLAIVNVDYVNKHDYLKGVLNAINNAPTVIPAEEGET